MFSTEKHITWKNIQGTVPENSKNNVVVQPVSVEADGQLAACPMCGAEVRQDAIECKACGEPFSPEAFKKRKTGDVKRKRSRWLFYIGAILILIGGPGVAFGSYLHDLLKIPIADYDNFESFGWVNVLVATVGIIILVIGIILLILSLPKLKAEDSKKTEEVEVPDK
jgi:uncharacterized membrane protein YcjF (UPF0283 family)